jgi:hypothetical protein
VNMPIMGLAPAGARVPTANKGATARDRLQAVRSSGDD